MNKINRAAPECSLYGFLATEAPVGVILRRGPSKFVQMIKWNTDDDTFELGQWFKGRVYEFQSDLSADGAYFLYKAVKHNVFKDFREELITHWWHAVSKPPYFTALAVWGWNGYDPIPEDNGVRGIKPAKGSIPVGWKFRGSKQEAWPPFQEIDVQEKEIPGISGMLVTKRYRYTIRTSSEETRIERADWADVDQHGRLVFSRGGKLFACNAKENDVDNAIELADFSESIFEPIAAPEWAKAW